MIDVNILILVILDDINIENIQLLIELAHL